MDGRGLTQALFSAALTLVNLAMMRTGFFLRPVPEYADRRVTRRTTNGLEVEGRQLVQVTPALPKLEILKILLGSADRAKRTAAAKYAANLTVIVDGDGNVRLGVPFVDQHGVIHDSAATRSPFRWSEARRGARPILPKIANEVRRLRKEGLTDSEIARQPSIHRLAGKNSVHRRSIGRIPRES